MKRPTPFVSFASFGLLLIFTGACQRGASLSSTPVEEPSKGWVSSGGEIFSDRQNPWFLENVPAVRYCVQVDQPTFSAPADKVAELVARALQYWKQEFAPFHTAVSTGPNLTPAVASQTFEPVGCDGNEDLRFQFGYGTLDATQLDFLRHENQYLSLAVRTGYDARALRGRGFVYIASDIGEHRQPQGAPSIDQPWRYEGLLFRVVLHELGHVFGLPHLGNGLMAEIYPETLLHTNVAPKYQAIEPLEHFFMAQQSYTNCSLTKVKDQSAMEWLGMPLDDKCLYTEISNTNAGQQAEVVFKSSREPAGEKHAVGTARGQISANAYAQISLAGKIYLPPGQSVFTGPTYTGIKYLPTSIFVSAGFSVDYVTATTRERKPMQITLLPDGYELRVYTQDEIRTLLSYRKACESASSLQICLEI